MDSENLKRLLIEVAQEKPKKQRKWEILHKVALPLYLDFAFIPPDLEQVFNYYPNYRRFALAGGEEPFPFQAFICWIVKRIETTGAGGYTGDRAFSEFVQWTGGMEFFLKRYENFLLKKEGSDNGS